MTITKSVFNNLKYNKKKVTKQNNITNKSNLKNNNVPTEKNYTRHILFTMFVTYTIHSQRLNLACQLVCI